MPYIGSGDRRLHATSQRQRHRRQRPFSLVAAGRSSSCCHGRNCRGCAERRGRSEGAAGVRPPSHPTLQWLNVLIAITDPSAGFWASLQPRDDPTDPGSGGGRAARGPRALQALASGLCSGSVLHAALASLAAPDETGSGGSGGTADDKEADGKEADGKPAVCIGGASSSSSSGARSAAADAADGGGGRSSSVHGGSAHNGSAHNGSVHSGRGGSEAAAALSSESTRLRHCSSSAATS